MFLTQLLMFASAPAVVAAPADPCMGVINTSPVIAKLDRCEPLPLCKERDHTKPCGPDGSGNRPEDRQLWIHWSNASVVDGTKACSASETETIEVCFILPPALAPEATSRVCPFTQGLPGGEAFAIYSRGAGINPENEPEAGKMLGAVPPFMGVPTDSFMFHYDYWNPVNDGTAIYIRVNGDSTPNDDLEAPIRDGGFCMAPTKLAPETPAGDPRFVSFGLSSTTPPALPPLLNDPGMPQVCDGVGFGTSMGPGTAGMNNGLTPCVSDDVVKWYQDAMMAVDTWSETTAYNGTSPLTKRTWENGTHPTDCGPDQICPFQLLHNDMQGTWWSGGRARRIRMSTQGRADFPRTSWWSGARMSSAATHEYTHNIQSNWAEHGADHIGNIGFLEPIASALEGRLCTPGVFSFAPGEVCEGSAKVSGAFGTFGNLPRWMFGYFNNPSEYPFRWFYASGYIWSYLFEQYALPVDPTSQAHPKAVVASMQGADRSKMLRFRRSDEGTDLLLHFSNILRTGALPGDAWDTLLEDYLGRPFDNFMTDWHTAALLKSYVEIDPRWNIEWLGDPNVGAMTSPVAPLGSPPVTNMSLAQHKLAGTVENWDVLPPVARRVDVNFLQAGDTMRSNASLEINSYGAAYLSFRPEQVPHSLTLKLTSNGGKMPRFRVFVVEDTAAGGSLPVPVPQCANDPDGPLGTIGFDVCATIPGSKGDVSIPIQVGDPAGPKVDEILIVASAGQDDVSFDWSIGAHADALDVIYPSEVAPSLVSMDMGATSEKFIAQVRVTDANGLPSTGLTKEQFAVRVCDNDTAMSVTCIDVQPADTTLMPMTGGAYLMRVDIPDGDLSPLTTAPYDFEVGLRGSMAPGLIDREPKALKLGGPNSKISMQLVMDVSGSMMGDRIDSAVKAANFLVDSLSDNHDAGLVTFHNNAMTPVALDSLAVNRAALKNAISSVTAAACTSLGDGLLEMQSNFSLAYEDVIGPVNQDVDQIAVVLSDGLDTAAYHADRYYDGAIGLNEGQNDGTSVDGPPGCFNQIPQGEGPWSTFAPNMPLNWVQRNNWSVGGQRLKVPRVNGIAFGPDAATKDLDIISSLSGGSLLYVDTTATPTPVASISNNLSDAYRSVLTEREGLDRSHTGRTEDLEGYQFHVEQGIDLLKVSVATPKDPESTLFLKSPVLGATLVIPTRSTDRGVIFEVPATSNPMDTQPVGGMWTITRDPPPAPSPTSNPVFIEVAVHGEVRLHASVQPDVFIEAPDNGEDKTGHWVGRPIVITAVPFDDLPITNASASAELRRPDGTVVHLPLLDDGQHSDGDKGDGIYGFRYYDTHDEGLYDVKITVSGNSAIAGAFEREKRLGIGLHDGPNDDGDCMPTWWEELHGLDPLVDDGALDPDGDNLSNCGEFTHATDPRDPDTDDGGENDGSEVNVPNPDVRDPLDPSDDSTTPELPIVLACDGRVEVQFSSPSAHSVELQSAPTRNGNYVVEFAGFMPPDNRLELATPNGTSRCYRARSFPGGLVSGIASDWSAPVCVSTAEDTVPPSLTLEAASESPVGQAYPVRLLAADSAEDDHLDPHVPTCDGDVASGVVEYQITTDGNLDTEPWLPIVDEVVVGIQETGMTVIMGKVRDAAGNESELAVHVVSRLDSVCELSDEDLNKTVCVDGPQFVDIGLGDPSCAGKLIAFNGTPLDPEVVLDGSEILMTPGTYTIEWTDSAGLIFKQTFELELDISDACCPAGSTLIEGGPFQDAISRANSVDYCVFGAGGGDYISLGSGDDLIVGEAGSDYIVTGSGNDTVVGGSAQDSINGGFGGELTAHGGAGGDQIHANFSQSAQVFGGPGADHIVGSPGDDWIAPGSGAVSAYAGGGADTVVLFDLCEATPGMVLDGGSGFDTLILPALLSEVESAGVVVSGFEDIIENEDANAYLSDCHTP